MSWTTNTKECTYKSELTPEFPVFSDIAKGEGASQYRAAMTAVTMLLPVIGRKDDKVSVHITGHANPGHAPNDNFGDEFISISIYAHVKDQKHD